MTLGARPVSVLRQVLGEALLQASVGLVVGLLLAFALMRGLNSMLYEVTASDPMTFVAAALMVVAVALLAGAVPASRAMRVDPVKALRAD
jgi:putative ABC transport system permease protein